MMWGPKRLKQVQPVRPFAPTGQTGPAQIDRKIFGLVIYRVCLKLMTMLNLIIGD